MFLSSSSSCTSCVYSLFLFILLSSHFHSICMGQETEIATDLSYCNCQYNVPAEEESNCRVYGQLGDDVLIAYNRASSDCLTLYDIKISFMDYEQITMLCPLASSSSSSEATSTKAGTVEYVIENANVNGIVSELKFNPSSPTSRAIMASYSQFFQETDTPDTYTLLDTINGTTNCETDASDCWTIINEYFTANPNELNDICVTYYEHYRTNQELEQAIIRGRLCQEMIDDSTLVTDTTHVCSTLIEQIDMIMMVQPEKACSAYELGPGTATLPECSGSSNSSTGTGATTSDEDDEEEEDVDSDKNTTTTTTTTDRTIPGSSTIRYTTGCTLPFLMITLFLSTIGMVIGNPFLSV